MQQFSTSLGNIKKEAESPKVKKFRADLKYHLLAIDGVCENEPDRYQGLLKRLEKDLRGTAAWGMSGFPNNAQ